MRVEWRSVIPEPGALSVMIVGTQLMVVLPADSLASLEVMRNIVNDLSYYIPVKPTVLVLM